MNYFSNNNSALDIALVILETAIKFKYPDRSRRSHVFLKISQYSKKSTYICSLLLIKRQAFRPVILSKRGSKTGVFLWIKRNF